MRSGYYSTRQFIILLFYVFLNLPFLTNAQGYLKAEGKYIVDGSGKPVILRGIGLGGWMLQEGYMFRLSNLGQQYRIKAAISDLIGPEKTEIFYNKWLSNHTTKKDIDSMAAWGFNSIRLPMHYNLYTKPIEQEPDPSKNTWIEKGFIMTDSLLSWCKQNKIYLILDLHAAPGGQGHDLPISDRDTSRPSLWDSEANKLKTVALWRKLAERYANEPWIGAYDIINEPNWGFEDPTDKTGEREKKNEPLRKLMIDITKAIREVDKNHIIIIEGNRWGNSYTGVLPTWDPNMVLSFHKYGNYNNEAAIRHFLDLREKYNVPVWLGEAGENSNTWFTEAIHLVEANQIGWAWWQLKKMGNNNPLEIKTPDGYQELLDYWSKKGSKPSAEKAQQVLNELLDNIRIEKNLYHKDVTDAMFRQVNSFKSIPFRDHVIGNQATIEAVDFDMGRAGIAYSDRDTARYQWGSPPSPSAGNRGRAYRNDGVDIQTAAENDKPYHYIFHIEDTEWWQYAVRVTKAGTYTIQLQISAIGDTSSISVHANGQAITKSLKVPGTGGEQSWQAVEVKNLSLNRGINLIRIIADKGGFTFRSIGFRRQ